MLNQTIGELFFEKMLSGEVHFAYRTKNGALRIARGTLCSNLIPEEMDGNDDFSNSKNPNYTDYWDLDSDGWRTFNTESVVWCMGLYSKDLLHSEWVAIQEYMDSEI